MPKRRFCPRLARGVPRFGGAHAPWPSAAGPSQHRGAFGVPGEASEAKRSWLGLLVFEAHMYIYIYLYYTYIKMLQGSCKDPPTNMLTYIYIYILFVIFFGKGRRGSLISGLATLVEFSDRLTPPRACRCESPARRFISSRSPGTTRWGNTCGTRPATCAGPSLAPMPRRCCSHLCRTWRRR